MVHQFRASLSAVAIVAGAGLAPVCAAAQASTATEQKIWSPPRMSDGQPDIQGIWQTQGGNLTVSLEKGGVTLLDVDKVSNADVPTRSSRPGLIGIVDPADGKIPWQPWAAAKRKELMEQSRDPKGNLEYMDPSARCVAAGVPRINYVTPYNGYQFIQTPGQVVLFAEWNHETRVVPIDGRPHLTANIRLWMGDSRGRWEGNTLVVDATNFNGKTWFDWITFHTDALHVVERFTVIDADTINYEATIEDAKAFTKPWKVAFPFKRAGPGYRLFEYACHEGNHYMESVMK